MARMEFRFDRFMGMALHDPERGYYARRIGAIGGRRGDFTTAPMLSGCLGRAVAAWAARALRETGCRDLVEIGPGDGTLAETVWRMLPWPTRWRTRLHLVETSAPLRELQQKRLGRRARWHARPEEMLDACRGRAVVFSNELVDAFPVRRFQLTDGGWREMAVVFDPPAAPREILLEDGDLPASSVFAQTYPCGQRVEAHDFYREWLTGWLPRWRAGRMLTIDYGDTVETLYHRRPGGTLRGYLMQQRVEGADCYLNIGRQDLTADVNFTDLTEWSAPWTETRELRTLGEFIAPFADGGSAADRALADGLGAGGAFRVLEQRCLSSG